MPEYGYQPYSVVENSYNQFMGNSGAMPPSGAISTQVPGPIQYNTGVGALRPGADTTKINTLGSLSPAERIQRMADKQYQKWAAQQAFQNRVMGEFESARDKALQGVSDRNPYNTYTPVNPGRGSGSQVANSYDQFMNSGGAAGLFGGSVVPMSQRYQQWNSAIANQQQDTFAALSPVYQKFGMKMPDSPIAVPW